MVRETDDLLRVAGMRLTQRARLIDAGVSTATELASHHGPVPDLPDRVVTSLTAQARLQVRACAGDPPPYEIADPQPLTLLPNPDRGDLFFDFEGDPLWTPNGRDWGIEYLFGVLDARDGFHPLWAHDRAEERRALQKFLKFVRARSTGIRRCTSTTTPPTKSALLRLAGRYGVGEDDVDDLLRNGVLVDLYLWCAKHSGRHGELQPKSLEPLYMGAQLRTGEVTTAADSITQYARYCELRAEGRTDDASAVLGEIEDYNRYDCRSTRRLRGGY